MVTEDEYGNLRSIEGCDKQDNLPATKTDTQHISAIADALGVKAEDRYCTHHPTHKVMSSTHLEIKKRSRKYTVEGKQHLIIAYMGGHGATFNEQQIYLLNDADPNKAQFNIEAKLRELVR